MMLVEIWVLEGKLLSIMMLINKKNECIRVFVLFYTSTLTFCQKYSISVSWKLKMDIPGPPKKTPQNKI